MTDGTKEYLMKLVRDDYINAGDSVYRAKMQLERTPFDHDTRNALARYTAWRDKAVQALLELEAR